MSEYLFRRTDGVVGLLERLIEDGCTQAIDYGDERLSTGLLDGIDINLGNPAGRLPDAGEVPAVPQRPTEAKPNTARATLCSTTAACPGTAAPGSLDSIPGLVSPGRLRRQRSSLFPSML